MRFLKKSSREKIRLFFKKFFQSDQNIEIHSVENFPSKLLGRNVRVDIFLPPTYYDRPKDYFPTLFFNDGQDMEAVNLSDTLERLYGHRKIKKIIVIGIHAGNRIQEYGTANFADYKNRGNMAKAYSQFLIKELIPFLQKRYRLAKEVKDYAYAGFSLGGLSAFDIVWNQSDLFKKVGVFSGSFWWRSKAFRPEDPDADRIVHHMVATGKKREGLQFWLQTGTNDEKDDRNNNGIIDAIDDTLDLIKALKQLGYQDQDIKYVEVEGGEHNPHTWGKILPDFLRWAFG